MIEKLKQKWAELPPKHKQVIVLVLVLGAAVFLLFQYVGSRENVVITKRERAADNISTTGLLTGRDTSHLGIEGNSHNIKLLNERMNELTDKLDRFVTTTEKKFAENDNNVLHSKLVQLGAEIKGLKRQYSEQIDTAIDLRQSLNMQNDKLNDIAQRPAPQKVVKSAVMPVKESNIWETKRPVVADNAIPGTTTTTDRAPAVKIVVASAKTNKTIKKEPPPVDEGETIFLPAGSILSGTLITGMDAPTNETTQANPYPTTLRIKDEAILPNRYTLDLTECFIIAAGYGDLSSERAYIRGETISCINKNKEILESPIDLYAVGEDGKTGIRGRLVSKQGQVLARALSAGFMEGISDAFKPQRVPTVNLTPGQSVDFQSLVSTDALNSALLGGTSRALNRLADYYIELAEGIFPVIEVDAGRKIDMIVKKGVQLKFQKKN